MKNTRLENICIVILSRWEDRKPVTEQQISVFMEEILALLTESKAAKLPDSYSALYRKFQEVRHYHEIDQMAPQDAFLLGSVWGGMVLVEKKYKRAAERMSLEDLAHMYKNYEWFFRTLKSNPGLNHAQLAKKGGKTPSELSQFTAKISRENLFNANRLGREKYYFISPRGEKLLQVMRRNHPSEIKLGVSVSVNKIDRNNEMQQHGVVGWKPVVLPDHFKNSIADVASEYISINSLKGGFGAWSSMKQNSYSNFINNYPALGGISLISQR